MVLNGLLSADMLADFFGWMLLINVIFLIIGHLKLTLFRPQVLNIATKIYGADGEFLLNKGPKLMAYYYILVIVFNLVPYLALRIVQ